MNPISLIVVVRNEEKRITDFLMRAGLHVGEITLVDQASTDRTREFAEVVLRALARPYKIIDHPCHGFSEASNPEALAQCTQPWVLVLFPDEYATDEFLNELPKFCYNADWDGYRLPRDTFIGGRKWAHEATIRLVRREHIRVKPVVHNDPTCATPRVHTIELLCLIHDKTEAEQAADNQRYLDLKNGMQDPNTVENALNCGAATKDPCGCVRYLAELGAKVEPCEEHR